ncbi:MAG TPA: hypothetical protein VLU23_09575 [Pseudolabrys sp.]|nr:hypothetical protein [Pseudolabrys sp.]
MAGAETTVERLRQFLRELSPGARSLLIGELERAVLRGEEVTGADLVLQELRRIMREQREGALRIEDTARLLFKPLEPFLVDDRGDHKHPGRVARSSLEALWNWILRDLLPNDANDLAADVSEAMLAGDQSRTERLARIFQDRVAAAIEAKCSAGGDDEKIRRRILQQIGTPRAGEELIALKCALKGRDVLASLSARLPLQIGNLANDQLDECKTLIESAAARDGELFLYALLTVMNRMTAPWQLIRLGVKAAGSDTAARVAETHYGVAVNIVLAELERMVAELRADLRSGQGIAVGALLKTIHDSARGLRTELALPVDSTWGRTLAAQRTQISDLLRAEIESMPSRVQRLLRLRPSREIRPNSVLDPNEVAEVEALVEFVGICRYFAGELAINEMTQRAVTELRQYLDNGTRALLESLRHAGEGDRSFRQSQVDAAVRFCAKVFGREYAALLGKAAEVAGAAESRAARA